MDHSRTVEEFCFDKTVKSDIYIHISNLEREQNFLLVFPYGVITSEID